MPKATTAEEAIESAFSASDSQSEESKDSQSQPSEDEQAAIESTGEEIAPKEESEPGPIPLDRHKAILEKQRAEAEQVRQELESYRQNYGWAEQFDVNQYRQQQEQLKILAQLANNPLDFYRRLGRELEADPHLGPQFKAPQSTEVPKPSLRTDDGKAAYTADEAQALVSHYVAQAQAQVAEQIQSLHSRLEQLGASDQARTMQSQAAQYSHQLMSEFRELPGFKEHETDIQQVFAGIPAHVLEADGVKASLYSAYLKVYQSKVLPNQGKQSEKKVLDTLKRKASAGSLDPSTSGTSGTKRPRTERDLEKLLKEMAS